MKSFRLFSKIWGVEGELASKSLYARRKAFRASSLSLTLSFMVFSLFLNFWVLSRVSTKYTYFERYKDTWDLMAAVKEESGGMPPDCWGHPQPVRGHPVYPL